MHGPPRPDHLHEVGHIRSSRKRVLRCCNCTFVEYSDSHINILFTVSWITGWRDLYDSFGAFLRYAAEFACKSRNVIVERLKNTFKSPHRHSKISPFQLRENWTWFKCCSTVTFCISLWCIINSVLNRKDKSLTLILNCRPIQEKLKINAFE